MNAATAVMADTPALPQAAGLGRTLGVLMRREFWEYRALWRAPLAVAVLFALVALFPIQMHFDLSNADMLGSREQRVAIATIVQWALSVPLYLTSGFVLTYYLLDCLYAERKDRSILFWKSLPVSDGRTVLSKALVALVVVPLGVFVLSLLSYLVFSGLWEVRVLVGRAPPLLNFDAREWLRTEIVLLGMTLLAMLWYAPVAAFLLVMSAWWRRAPWLWATLLPIVAGLFEFFAFGTHYVRNFIAYRSFGIWAILGVQHANIISHDAARPVGSLMEVFDFRAAFFAPGLWLGVAATVILVMVAARIRRYRDDT
jgi:ABC-2 type transport system permease protein